MRPLRLLLVNVGRRTVNCPAVTLPIGLLSLAAYLRERLPLDVRVMDQLRENVGPATVVDRARSFEPEVIGLRALTTSAQLLRDVVCALRVALPRSLIVLGGPHPSAFKARTLEDIPADVAVVGEGERSAEAVLQCFTSGSSFDSVPGLIWRDRGRGEQIVVNPGTPPLVDDVDSLPFPAYDLLDMEPYFRIRRMSTAPPQRYVPLMTSRGCPYQCIYCHQVFGKRFRAQSAEHILDEVNHLIRQFGITEIELLDDIFNLHKDRVVKFCEGLLRQNAKIRLTFPNALRCDILTQEVVDALVDAGTYYAACALESGSPRIQKEIGKHLNIPRFQAGVSMLSRGGVYAHGFTMLGFPTETAAEMQQTIDIVSASDLLTATFFTVTPYPSTRLYEMAQTMAPEKLARVDYEDANYTNIPVNLSAVPDDVFFAFQRRAWRTFYLNPARVVRIVRRYPHPLYLPSYLPMFALRLTKGLWRRKP